MSKPPISLPKYRTEIIEDYFKPDTDVSLKVLLAVPPQSHPPTAPHPALPYLKGYLGQALPNVSVAQKDLDAIFFSYAFSQEELARRFSPQEAARIRQAYEAQRSSEIYQNVPRFIESHQTLEAALDEISKQHREANGATRESLTLRGNTFTYISDFLANSRQGVLDAISPQNREKNLFYQYYRDIVVPHIVASGYDVVGLSVFLTDQLIPTFLLASMIKEKNSDIKIILGGNYLSRFRDTLSKNDDENRKLFESIDSIVLKEGEVPLRNLLQRIGRREGFEEVNQVIYKDSDGEIKVNFDSRNLPQIDMDRLPRPDFDGIFTDLEGKVNVFWTPSPVISLYTQRGCNYAGGCDFCSIMDGNNDPKSRLARSPERVAEDMKLYQEKYGAKVFSFGNETLTRSFMVGLARELDRLGLEATIDGYTRTDQFHNDGIDMDRIKQIAKYFRFLQIGFESSDEETLSSMKKGRKPAYDSELAKALFDNGIMPHAFLLLGFPPPKDYKGRSRNDYIRYYMRSSSKTLEWLIRNNGNLGTFEPTYLMVPRDDAKMVSFRDGKFVINDKYAHEIELEEPRDLEFNIPYQKRHGSRKLDTTLKAIFDVTPTPHRTYTHNTIYHQRLFNWKAGIEWSLNNPEQAQLLSNQKREEIERKLLTRLWNTAVGQDYLETLRELTKKSGVSKEKRKILQHTIAEIRQKNIMANNFPDGIDSIQELIEADF